MQDLDIRKSNPIATVVIMLGILGSLVIVCLFIYSYTRCVVKEERYYAKKFNPDVSQFETYSLFYKYHGSPVPNVMAQAIIEVKPKNRPKVAAISIKESHGTPWAVGDKGKSKGAWQVQEKHWGKVPISTTDQALQAERILEELVASEPRGSLRCALAMYNGGTNPPPISYRYADRIMDIKRGIANEQI